MKEIPNKTSGDDVTTLKKKKASNPQSLQISLTEAEREVLLEACKRYRYKIPAYIRSKEPELRLVDEIIAKLS